MNAITTSKALLLLVLGLCCAGCQPSSHTPPQIIHKSGAKTRSPAPVTSTPSQPIAQKQETLDLRPLRIGLLIPLSGPHAVEGHHILNAAMMGIQDWQKPMELYPIDTCGTPEGSLIAYRKLHKKGIDVILGPLFSKELKILAQQDHLPLTLSFSNDIQDQPPEPVLRLGAFAYDPIERLIQFGLKKGFKNYALIIPTSPYGQKLETLIIDSIHALGQTCSTIVRYDYSRMTPDLLMPLAHARADAWIVTEAGPRLDALMDQLKGVLPSHPPVLSIGMWSDETRQQIRSSNIFLTLAHSERFAAFQKRYKDLFHQSPSILAAFAYDGISLISLLRRSESLTGALLSQTQGFEGVQSTFRFHNRRAQRLLSVFAKETSGCTCVDPAPQSF